MKTTYFLILSLFAFFSCKKEEDKKSVLIEELSKSEWRKSSILYSADSVAPDTIPTISPAVLLCQADNIWHFNASTNTFVLDEGPTKCNAANPQIKDEGAIEDLGNGTRLRVEGGGTNEIWEIESRTSSSFRVSYFGKVGSQTRKLRVTFSKI